MINKHSLSVCTLVAALFLFITPAAANEVPADPLESVMWESMVERFFSDGKVVLDQRVRVLTPASAEDQFHVPITIDARGLQDVVEITAVADLNPIPQILTMRPIHAQPFIGFRVKLQQTSPIHVGVKTADGIWHVNGTIVDAAGGGCTAPAMAHSESNWMDTLGITRAVARREDENTARLTFKMKHPMDTGLASGIPVFYMSEMRVKAEDGTALADLKLFEPVSENPTLTLKPLVGETDATLLVQARDTEGHEFEFPLSVPAHSNN